MREEMDIQDSFLEACQEGDIEKVKFLLEKGVDIEAKDDGNTPLIYASFNGNIEVVKFLLEKGVNIEAKDYDGKTSLIWASWHGYRNIEIMKLLIEKGADVEAKDNNGNTFYIYLNKENKKIIDFVLKDIEERKRMIKPCKK